MRLTVAAAAAETAKIIMRGCTAYATVTADRAAGGGPNLRWTCLGPFMETRTLFASALVALELASTAQPDWPSLSVTSNKEIAVHHCDSANMQEGIVALSAYGNEVAYIGRDCRVRPLQR